MSPNAYASKLDGGVVNPFSFRNGGGVFDKITPKAGEKILINL